MPRWRSNGWIAPTGRVPLEWSIAMSPKPFGRSAIENVPLPCSMKAVRRVEIAGSIPARPPPLWVDRALGRPETATRSLGDRLRMDGGISSAYGRPTQTIPAGETIRKDGAEGATGPGNSQANGPQEDGSLESGLRLIRRAPTDEVSRRPLSMGKVGESFRSPDRGGRERRSPCVRQRDSDGDSFERTHRRPAEAHASL